jgi:hypothetical protein
VVSVTPRPRFSPGKRTPGTHCTGGCVGSRDGLDTKARGKILFLFRGPNLDQFVVAVSGKMVLVRIRHHAMIAYWEVEVQLHSLLTVLEDMSVQLHAPSAGEGVPVRI